MLLHNHDIDVDGKSFYVLSSIVNVEFIYEAVNTITEGVKAFIGGFARLFLTSLILWMISLVVLLFRELFRPGDLDFKEYFKKVWAMFKLSFEMVAYGALVIAPVIMYFSEEKLIYSMVWVASILLSCLYFYLRKQSNASKGKERSVRFNRFK